MNGRHLAHLEMPCVGSDCDHGALTVFLRWRTLIGQSYAKAPSFGVMIKSEEGTDVHV